MTNFFLGVHGLDSSIRSGHSVEVYGNTNWISLGTDYQPFVGSRGGTGLVYSNELHATVGATDVILLQSYRSGGVLAADEPDYKLRFPYHMKQLDGHSPYDGNTTNGIAGLNVTGSHDGGNNSAFLSVAGASWAVDAFKGTGTYATNDNLQTFMLWNRTDGSVANITASTGTTITGTLYGGTDNDWDSGDVFLITYGYPGLDQNGWAGPTTFNGTFSTQTLTPWYQWANTWNGSAGLDFEVAFLDSGHTTIAQPQSDLFIQENREYYNNIAKPGYVPYTYPHPLVGGTRNITISGTITAGTLTVAP
jgi:hypothetical protein